MKLADPSRTVTRRRAQPALRHLRLGRGVLRPDARQPRGGRPADARARSLDAFTHWDDIDVHFRGRSDHLGRPRLLRHRRASACSTSCSARCEALGVELVFETEVDGRRGRGAAFDADLVVAADGINSRIRDALRRDTSRPTSTCAAAASSGSARTSASTRSRSRSSETEHGWFQAHAYQFDDDTSTFIVETPEETWQARRPRRDESPRRRIAFCERAVRAAARRRTRCSATRAHLRGSAIWIHFPRVVLPSAGCTGSTARRRARGAHGRRRAHRALLDRLGHQARDGGRDRARARARRRHGDARRRRSSAYEAERRVEVLKHPERGAQLDRVVRERRALRRARGRAVRLQPADPQPAHPPREPAAARRAASSRASRRWFAERVGRRRQARGRRCSRRSGCAALTLANRVVVSPMAQYSCARRHARRLPPRPPGQPRARRRRARVHRDDLRRARRAHHARLRRACGTTRSAARLDSASSTTCTRARRRRSRCSSATPGRKGSTQLGWEGADEPLADGGGNWPLIAPSAIRSARDNQVPRAMTRADMDAVRAEFVAGDAARRGRAASTGSSCTARTATCSRLPLARSPTGATDEYGGTLDEPAAASRSRCSARCAPRGRPSGRCRCASRRTTGREGGNTPDDAVAIARAVQARRAPT